MLSYVYFGTNDLARAIRFYDATLTRLGMQRCVTNDPEWDRVSAGWGIFEDGGARELAFWVGTPFNQQQATTGNGSMVAFSATSWQAVDDFHKAALTHGGISEGAPGLRLHYAPDFYAAYVRDPDGNKLCAVCRGTAGSAGRQESPERSIQRSSSQSEVA
jgi:catechol 2,3-dioxygenase-like lactoylglutathione lyase family enzyme